MKKKTQINVKKTKQENIKKIKPDKVVKQLIKNEEKRQNKCLELIASENFASKQVRKAMSSCLTNKYAEGYPHHRYYGGCETIDKLEQLAIDRACKLFGTKYANVQPHSGSQANAAAYHALETLLKKTGKLKNRKMRILTMSLNDGSHLTHGSNVSFSSKLYDFKFFNLGANNRLNFKAIEEAIRKYNPDIILTGYSAYPYEINFKKFKDLANEYDCLLMVDMAHIAGLVAAKEHSNPCLYADIVTSTTHKTLRGPRGGLILTNRDDLISLINSAVFPLEHVIAAKAICFSEAATPAFAEYIKQVKINTKAFTNRIKDLGAICSDTDTHLVLLDVKKSFGITGNTAQLRLEDIGIVTNKNMIPNDTETPNTTSGLRIGFAALTTRGCTEQDAIEIADIIYIYLKLWEYLTLTNSMKLIKKLVNKIIRKLHKI